MIWFVLVVLFVLGFVLSFAGAVMIHAYWFFVLMGLLGSGMYFCTLKLTEEESA